MSKEEQKSGVCLTLLFCADKAVVSVRPLSMHLALNTLHLGDRGHGEPQDALSDSIK